MSAPEHAQAEQAEPRSRIKLTRNAKGEPQWEISVITEENAAELERIRKLAVEQWRALERELGSAA